MTRSLSRFLLCVLAAAAAASSVAYAQDGGQSHKGTAEQQRACRADALRLCRGIHDDEAVFQCLRKNVTKLHSACRDVIEGTR